MKTKHTQGPWEIKDVYFPGTKVHKGLHIFSNQKLEDIEICDLWGSATIEGQANAKLIAAAPDLLEACINSFATLIAIGCTMDAKIMQQLESAIKKATE